jgi:hypothetical protein
MRKRDLHHVYHELWDQLADDQADAREALHLCDFLRRALPLLMDLHEVSPAAIVQLLDECRGMTCAAASEEIERFVCKGWHTLPKKLQQLLDEADTVKVWI